MERWYRDGEPIWREPDDVPRTIVAQPWAVSPEPTLITPLRAEPEASQLPESTNERSAAPGPFYAPQDHVYDPGEVGLGTRLMDRMQNPNRIRALARILRVALETGSDDAA